MHMTTTIKKILGFDCSLYADLFLARRIKVRLRTCKLSSYGEYEKRLVEDPEESKKLYTELTIHTTNFFRDYDLWTVIQKDLLPLLEQVKQETRSTTINI